MKPSFTRAFPLVVLAAGIAACTMHPTEAPPLSGPSSFAHSLSVAVTPDQIVQDGSRSSVVASMRDASGTPMAGVPLQLSILVNNSQVEFGSLSSRMVYTDSTGTAGAMYSAPVAGPFFAGGPSTVVAIYVTPVGNNYDVSMAQRATIRVTPPPIPAPEPGAPTAWVTYTPATPKVGDLVIFDATGSKATPGHQIVNWFWDFGDGRAHDEHGDDASHAYASVGSYTMVLGVADELGRTSTAFKTIVVSR